MNARKTDHLSAWSALLSFLLGGFTIASASEYEVDGQLEQRIYNLDASVGALESKGVSPDYQQGAAWRTKGN